MFPAHSVLLSRWVLPSERGWASAQGEIAMSVASMGVPLLIATLEASAGWRAGFYAVGTVCVLYILLAWLRLASSSPASCAYIDEAELALLKSSTSGSAPPSPKITTRSVARTDKGGSGGAVPASKSETWRVRFPAPAHRVLLHPTIVALFSCHAIYNLTTLSINSWTPSYYAEVLLLPPEQAKLHLTLPHVAAMIVKLCVSQCAQALRARGHSMLFSRRLMCLIGYLTTAAPVLLVPFLSKSPAWMTTLCFSLALAGTGFHAEGFRANYLDVTRAHVGLVSGVGNCNIQPRSNPRVLLGPPHGARPLARSRRSVGLRTFPPRSSHSSSLIGPLVPMHAPPARKGLSSVAAMVAPLIVGSLVQAAGSWDPVWYCISAACVASTAIFCTLSSTTPVEELLQPSLAAAAKAKED